MPALGPARRSRFGRMYGISPEQLRAFMAVRTDGKHSVLLLDCRTFVAYNSGHIADAVNAHCPAILRRRGGGRLPLRTIVPNSNVRCSLSEDHPVVLYDECGGVGKGETAGDESTAGFVAKCLRNEADLKSIYYLDGGFQNFLRLYPELVTQPQSVSCGPPCPSPGAGGECGPVEILPHLLLGSARDAARRDQLRQLGVTSLLNVTQLCPNLFQGEFEYKCIPVRDTGCEDIASHFQEAIHFIDQVQSRNGKVLVHCQAGISRSATICIAYLMRTRRMRMEEAYKFVKSRRRIVSPNFSFMGQLLSFEGQIFSSPSNTPTRLPRSPLLAVDALTPDPDSLTPSAGAQHSAFDFGTDAEPSGELASSLADNCHKLNLASPCVT